MKILIFLLVISTCSAEVSLAGLKSKIDLSPFDLRYSVFDFDVIRDLRNDNLVLIDGTALVRPNVDNEIALYSSGNLKKIVSQYFKGKRTPTNGSLVMIVVSKDTMIKLEIGNINGIPEDLKVSPGDLIVFHQIM